MSPQSLRRQALQQAEPGPRQHGLGVKILEDAARTPAHLHNRQPVRAERARGPPEPNQALEKLGFFFPEQTMRPVNSVMLKACPGFRATGRKKQGKKL